MTNFGEEVSVGFGADLGGLQDGFQKAASMVSEGAKSLTSSMGLGATAAVALGTAFVHLGEKMVEVVKDALRESITGFGELGDAIEHLQHRIGGSAQDLSVLKVGLESVGLNTQTYEMIARRLPQVLNMHAAAFKAAGVAYTDAAGNLLPMQDVIANLNTHLEKFAAGSARNTEGVNLMGRAFFMMADMIELTKERQQEATAVAQQFGEVLDDKDLQATNEFRRQTELLWIALKGFGLEIGRAVEPVLTELARAARDVAAPAFTVFKTVVEAVAAIFNGLSVSANILVNSFVIIIASAAAVVKALNAIAHHDLKGAENAWGEWKAVASQALNDVTTHIDVVNERMRRLIAGPGAAPSEPHPKDPNAGKRTPGDLAIVDAEAKAVLDLKKEKLREEGELNENWHKQELESDGAYWDKKIKLEQAGLDAQIASLKSSRAAAAEQAKGAVPGSEDAKNARAKEIALTAQIQVAEKQRVDAYVNGQREMKAAVDARNARELTAEFQNASKIATIKLGAQQDSITRQHDLHLTSDADEIRATGDLELKKLDIEKAALLKEQGLYDSNNDKYKSIQQQMDVITATSAAKRDEIIRKSAEAEGLQWKKLFDSMESGFQGTITNFLKGTATLGQTIKGLYTDVVDAIIGELARIAAAWMTQQIAMLIFGKTAAVGTIQSEAAKAGAGGVASMAAAPFPIDLGAPAFGAAMFAASTAYASGLPGFAVGSWNVPEDAFTKIHKGEMIMPAQFAEPLRNGGLGKGGDTHVHIHATDAASVERLLAQNGSSIMSAVRKQVRNFNGKGLR